MNTWQDLIDKESAKDYYMKLMIFLDCEYEKSVIYPDRSDIFRAFDITDFSELKVVILGQDPYHGEGEAHGLSFSVKDGVKIPPSLANIYKELNSDLNKDITNTGNLEHWAEQGVLLLNTVLTVRKDEPHSHKNQGWEVFTEEVIKSINKYKQNVVFILWGKSAQSKKKFINDKSHFIIESPHPSPLSSYRGFFGSKPFSRTNSYLEQKGIKQISW